MSTPVPAPGGGDVDETVATRAIPTGTTAPLTGAADFGGDVSARVVSVSPITAEAMGPGESTGPALSVTVEITNDSRAEISLDGTSVTLQDSTGAPGLAMSGDPYRPVRGRLAPGDSERGVYVFAVSSSDRSPVTISVRYSTEAPVVLFVGDAK